MKKIVLLLLCVGVLGACDTKKTESTDKAETESSTEGVSKEASAFASFGDEINQDGAIDRIAMMEKFEGLKAGDTVAVKFATTINEVCKKKGCWMKLDLGSENESMVTFKDYGFFVPLDADNKEVVVDGRAFIKEISVKELQHFAKDAGKSADEIAAITQPEVTYSFEADGVLVKK